MKVLSSVCRLTGGPWRALESHSSTVVLAHAHAAEEQLPVVPSGGESVVSDGKIGKCFTAFLLGRLHGLCGLGILRCKCSPVVPAVLCCDGGTAAAKIVTYTSPKQGRGNWRPGHCSTWVHEHSSFPISHLLVKSWYQELLNCWQLLRADVLLCMEMMSWLEVTVVSCNNQCQERPYQTLTDQLEAAKHPDRSNELKLSREHTVLKTFRAHS